MWYTVVNMYYLCAHCMCSAHPSCRFVDWMAACSPTCTYVHTMSWVLGKDAFILDKYSVQGSLPKVAAEVGRVVLSAMHLKVSCVYMHVCTYETAIYYIRMSHLHYIIAGAAKSSGLVSGAATQVILDTYVYQEHTTHVRMCMYV